MLSHEASDWIRANLTIVGCVIIGLFTICLSLSAIIKAKGDKARGRKSTRYYIIYAFCLLISWAGIFAGTYLTKHAGDVATGNAEKRQVETQHKLAQLEDRIQTVLTELRAAKREDSAKINEEKIRVLGSDFAQWAQSLAQDGKKGKHILAELRATLAQRQMDEERKEVHAQLDRSDKCYKIFAFAARFLEESVRAYAAKSGNTNITIDKLQFPENFFDARARTNAYIHLGTNVWTFSLTTGDVTPSVFDMTYSAYHPYFKIVFMKGDRQEVGKFHILVNGAMDRMGFAYQASPPLPDPATINQKYDLTDYEAKIKDALQPILQAQLLQIEEP